MVGHTLPDWLVRRAFVMPDAPALIAPGGVWSFAELDRAATATARRLATLGVQPGESVALLLRNSQTFVALAHAMPRLGAVLLPLNTRLSVEELRYQIEDSGARLLIFDTPNAALVAELRQLLPDLPIAAADRSTAEHEHDDIALPEVIESGLKLREHIDLTAVHTIIYTSGTTGRPKGAMLTYGNHWWSATGSALNLGTQTDDRWLAVLPFFHVGGLSILMRGAIYGIPVALPESSDPADINRAIDEHNISIISVVSTLLQRMLAERGERPYPPSLRCVLLGGGPAPRPLLDACAARGLPVVQTYGMSETASQVVTLAPGDALRKLGSAGKPLLPNELRIMGKDAPVAPGEIGEIQVRGPSVMLGYVNQPEATLAAMRDGWLRTGDLGYLDDEGFLYVVDRRDDLIISGGENIYPAEVEAALLADSAVAEAAVVGVPDATWGQVPVAFVVAAPGAAPDAGALLAHCRQRLAAYKVPRAVHLVDALPRNAGGKLMRAALRNRMENAAL